MAPVIHIQPVEAWGFYAKNHKRLEEELVEIASETDTNTSVYITDEDGTPYIYVYRDDKKVFQSECRTIYSTERNLQEIYAKYLTEPNVDDGKEASSPYKGIESVDQDDDDADVPPFESITDMSDEEFDSLVNEREDEIYLAIYEMLEVLTADDLGTSGMAEIEGATLENIINHIVEYIAIDCGIRVRRPMLVTDDAIGAKVRSEYPYEEYDFREDELHS